MLKTNEAVTRYDVIINGDLVAVSTEEEAYLKEVFDRERVRCGLCCGG